MSKFSILIPVKNGGDYLKQCVASILSQTYSDFELIIFESQSTDGTAEWLKSVKDSRVKIDYSTSALNINQNWERILSEPKNEFMTICGQDDILLPDYLQEMNNLISLHPEASLYQSHFAFIDKNSDFIRHCLPMDERQHSHELLAALLAHTFDSMATGYLFRSKDYENLGGISNHYPDLLYADNELWINLTVRGYKATSFKECFQYRHHKSLSRTTAGMNFYKSFYTFLLFLKMLSEKDLFMNDTIRRYGKAWLLKNCEAVAHRLLKTPTQNRTISVKEFTHQCRQFSEWLIPGQAFNPSDYKKIKMAEKIDSNILLRNSFKLFEKFTQENYNLQNENSF